MLRTARSHHRTGTCRFYRLSHVPKISRKYSESTHTQIKNESGYIDNAKESPVKKIRSFDSQKLLSAIAELERFNIRLKNFPTAVMFGNQSSGKTSAIHGLVGEYLLPTDMKMATRKPTVITTLKSEQPKYKIGDKEFTNSRDAADEIARLNHNSHIKKIDITVMSPKLCPAMFIDLPGLFSVTDESTDATDKFKKEVKSYVAAYMSNSNFIPIIVHAAPQDPATNNALKLITKHGRRNDAFGIITKTDMLKHQKMGYLERMLNGTDYKLGYGYCAVVLSSDKDIENGITVEDKIRLEKAYFEKINISPAGIPALRQRISDIQAEKILELKLEIVNDINNEMNSLKNAQNFLSNLTNGDNKALSANLGVLLEKFFRNNHGRAKFEKDLKDRIKQEIMTHLTNGAEDKPFAIETIPRSKLAINYSIQDYLYKNKLNTSEIDKNKFREIFSMGSLSPSHIDNKNLADIFRQEIIIGTILELFEITTDDHLGIKKQEWIDELNSYISRLLKDETIHKIIKDNTLKLLLEYIYNDPDCNDATSRKFAEFMIHKIGNEIFESHIKYSITAMLTIEKRPIVDIHEIVRYFIATHPEFLKLPEYIFVMPEYKKIILEIYGPEWRSAYNKVLVNNIANNCYRNVAVNLLDKMVQKLLEMTFDMFHKENASKEQIKVDEKMKTLQNIREILLSSKIEFSK